MHYEWIYKFVLLLAETSFPLAKTQPGRLCHILFKTLLEGPVSLRSLRSFAAKQEMRRAEAPCIVELDAQAWGAVMPPRATPLPLQLRAALLPAPVSFRD